MGGPDGENVRAAPVKFEWKDADDGIGDNEACGDRGEVVGSYVDADLRPEKPDSCRVGMLGDGAEGGGESGLLLPP